MGFRRLPLLLLALLAVLAGLAHAQPGRPSGPDLNQLALHWARGDYRAPLVCEIDGQPHRGLRRVLVAPAPRHTRPAANRIQLFDLDVPQGSRCYTDTGKPQPNALGGLLVALEAASRTDTAQHDFAALLRREGGVDFGVRAGTLRVGEAGNGELRDVEFAGGTARFSLVKRGSDAYRRLASFGGRRKLSLVLAAPDGTRLELELVQYGER